MLHKKVNNYRRRTANQKEANHDDQIFSYRLASLENRAGEIPMLFNTFLDLALHCTKNYMRLI